jgi:8-oxo-dGTP pyrophosphatase MutT (NUDIX family)
MSGKMEFRAYVGDIVTRYLRQFPEETDRLAELLHLITREGIDLRSRKSMAGHITASALVIDFTTEKLLLVFNRGLDLWLQPGGHLENDELMREGAAREVAEEVGKHPFRLHAINVDPEVPVDIDTHRIPALPTKSEGEHLHHDFRFVFSVKGGDWVRIDENEIQTHRWIPMSELEHYKIAPGISTAVRKVQAARSCTLG